MKFASLAIAAVAFALPTFAQTAMVATEDNIYDDPNGPVGKTVCPTVLNPKGYYTFGSLPNFPYIGGMKIVTYGSDLCGSCWNITYKDTSIKFLAIDHLENPDINLSVAAADKLRGDETWSGRLPVTVEKLQPSDCGMH